MSDQDFMRRAIALAFEGMRSGAGGPFGSVVVRGGHIIGRGCNRVLADRDPTAHAEMVAIREACRHLNHFQLTGCTIYTSCEPCPMCLGAIFWARPDRLVYACTRSDAAAIDFDDAHIYEQIQLPPAEWRIPSAQTLREEALLAFEEYRRKPDKIHY